MNRLDYWKNFIRSSDLDSLAADLNSSWDRISKKYNSFTPLQDSIISNINENLKDLTVLDFGCGLGRNIENLSNTFGKVIGYDLPEMVERFKQLHGEAYTVFGNWNEILEHKIDIIFDCTVFQHLDIELLYHHLSSSTAKYIYSHTRCYNDTGRDFRFGVGGVNLNNFIISNTRYKNFIVDKDITSNILNRMDETHYDILYI